MDFRSNKVKEIRETYIKELQSYYPVHEATALLDLILSHRLLINRTTLALNPELRVSESEMLIVHFDVKELKKYRPIQYIFGEAWFDGFSLKVNENVLIPRPETEELVLWAVDSLQNKKNLSILDIGTGSGCIAIALAKRLPTSHISACDVSRDALILAGENAKNLKVNIDFFNLDILKSDSWINACVYDVIISNPPYVTNSEKAAMQPNVLNWEPSLALFVNDDDPLIYYRKTLQFCINHLKSSGTIFFEINQHFGNELYDLLSSSGFKDIIIKKDLSGNDRMLSAVKLQQ